MPEFSNAAIGGSFFQNRLDTEEFRDMMISSVIHEFLTSLAADNPERCARQAGANAVGRCRTGIPRNSNRAASRHDQRRGQP